MRRISIATLTLALLALGCTKKKPAPPAPTPTLKQLFGEEDLTQLKKKLVAELQSFKPQKCERPVLEGTAVDGSAAAGLRQLVEPKKDSPTARCYTATATFESKFGERFRSLIGPKPGQKWPKRSLPYVATMNPTLPAEIEGGLKQVGEACKELIPTIKKVLQHKNGCTPYLPGRLREPASWNIRHLGRALIALQFQKPAPAPLDAAKNLMLLFRLTQDLSRGGVSLLSAMVLSGMSTMIVPYIEAILREGKVPEGKLNEIWTLASRLNHSELDFRSILRAERLQSGISLIASLDPTWQPPGGRPIGALKRPTVTGNREQVIADAILGQAIYGRMDKMCGMLSVPMTCISNLDFTRKGKAVKPRPEVIKAYKSGNLAALRKLPELQKLDWEKRAALLGLLLEPDVLPSVDAVLRGIYRRGFFIQAIRLHTALAFRTLKDKKIPEKLELKMLNARAYDRYAQRMLALQRRGTRFVISPPERLDRSSRLLYLIDLERLLPTAQK